MEPVHFPQVNRVLGKPAGMSDEECQPLPVFTDGQRCVSCYQLTDEDVADLVKTRRLWLHVWSGSTQPPVALATRCEFVYHNPEGPQG